MKNRIYPYLIAYRRMLSAVCAGLAVILLLSVIKPGGPQTSQVLVAARELPAGTELTEDDLVFAKLAKQSQWPGLVSDPGNYLGRVLAHSLAANQPLNERDLLGPELLTGLGPGLVAVAVPAGNESSNILLQVGDAIDIYGAASDLSSTAVLVAHNARVLALPQSHSTGMLSGGSDKQSVVVAINSGEANLVASQMGSGNFTFALLPQG